MPIRPTVTIVPSTVSVVADLDHQLLVRALNVDRGAAGIRVLGNVGEGLGDDVVGARFDRGRRAVVESYHDFDRHPAPLGQPRHRGVEPAVGEDRRMDAADQVAQLAHRPLGFLMGAREELRGAVGIGGAFSAVFIGITSWIGDSLRDDRAPPRVALLPSVRRGMEGRLRFVRGDWLQVEFPGGDVGWLRRGDVLLDDGEEVRHG